MVELESVQSAGLLLSIREVVAVGKVGVEHREGSAFFTSGKHSFN